MATLWAMQQPESSPPKRTESFLLLILAVFLLAAPLPANDVHRLTLQNGQPLTGLRGIKGSTEITVIPPFENARIVIRIDGELILTKTRPPYRIDVDLGVIPVEHRLQVTSASADGRKTIQWTEVINRGQHALGIKL